MAEPHPECEGPLYEQALRFLRSLALTRRLSPETVRAYDADLRGFLGFLRERLGRSAGVGDMTLISLRSFLGSRYEHDDAATVVRKLSALRTFCGFLKREGLLADNPALLVRPRRRAKKLPDFLSPEQATALLDGRIDLGVHSLKDMPTKLPDGIVLACVPEREDPRDALIAKGATKLEDLPHGAVLGTASLRRQAQALHLRPDLKVVTLRGNVDTRIAKLEAGDVAATFLAMAGLKRLGLDHRASGVIDPEAMPPAVGQGALAITARAGDMRVLAMLAKVEDADVRIEIEAERGLLEALDGSCRTPIAAHAKARSGVLTMIGETLTPDGKQRWRKTGSIEKPTRETARALGLELGAQIKREAGPLLYQA